MKAVGKIKKHGIMDLTWGTEECGRKEGVWPSRDWVYKGCASFALL